MSKTINQALADLVTGLGESSSVLADNSTISDYIGDLEDAIKKCAAAEAGEVLPAVTAEDNGKGLIVKNGAWSKEEIPTKGGICGITSNNGAVTVALPQGLSRTDINSAYFNTSAKYNPVAEITSGNVHTFGTLISSGDYKCAHFLGFCKSWDGKLYKALAGIGMQASDDYVIVEEITTT